MRYRYWVLIAVGLFVIGLCIGLVVSATMPANIVSFFSEEMAALEDLGQRLTADLCHNLSSLEPVMHFGTGGR